ncbi:hypothetical protein ACHAQA_001176 [Verticillium albo-atrum]
MSVELVLAAVAAADLCLKYGKRLVGAYKTMRSADEAIRDKSLIIEAIWSRTAVQVEFFERIAGTLEPEHCRIHLEILEVLNVKLAAAVTKIESVSKSGPEAGVHKFKYLFSHTAIESILSDLQQWQKIFDPTWYLILRMGSQIIDVELSKQPNLLDKEKAESFSSSAETLGSAHNPDTLPAPSSDMLSAQRLRGMLQGVGDADIHLSLSEDGLDWSHATDIAHATTRLVPRAAPRNPRVYAVDTIVCGPDLDVAKTRADAEALAKKLSQVDPARSGLMACHGLVKRKDAASRHLASINLVFHMPVRDASPQTLRALLLGNPHASLSRVLAIAQQLAAAVSFVHTCDFVHKNIRPETILVFPSSGVGMGPKGTDPLGSAFLAGFDSFRSVNFHTLRTGDDAWDRNLYRHPSRQGIFAQDDYVMQHDVYSLGVCLLELGLWDSFATRGPANVDGNDDAAVPSAGLGLALADFAFAANRESVQASPRIKDHLVDLARERLPMRVGDKYTAVVVTCLTCLDEDSVEFGEEGMKDEDGILVGVRFIEHVLLKLSAISL